MGLPPTAYRPQSEAVLPDDLAAAIAACPAAQAMLDVLSGPTDSR